MTEILRHRTAIGRGGDLSLPVRAALEADLLRESTSFFDYGCGRGEDLQILRKKGIDCQGWDPNFRPDTVKAKADVVNIGYVINVIESPDERAEAIRSAWDLTTGTLVVAGRLKMDAKRLIAEEFSDGVRTSRSTFQKLYIQSELKDWIATTLEEDPVAVAPGVFFVFRSVEDRQAYLFRRYPRRRLSPRVSRSEARYEENQAILQPLLDFLEENARLPIDTEAEPYTAIADEFGSLKRAFALVRRVTGAETWEIFREQRKDDLRLQFAMDRFRGRARFSNLPPSLQVDVREFFGSYKKACEESDSLLFQAGDMDAIELAMSQSAIGKRTGSALYIHASALDDLPVLLRTYEGCARAFIGDLVEADVIKLHRGSPRVSYLSYPDFDSDPHPKCEESFLVKLGAREISYRSYVQSLNPPILHRKEEFLRENDERREGFAKLTAQEEKWELYEEPQRIGTVNGWAEVLAEKNAAFRGRRLVRVK